MNMKSTLVCGAVLLLVTSPARAEGPPIVDRAELMSDPEISYALLSPDGHSMTFLKPYKGVRNVWIKKRSEPFDKARPISAETRPVVAPRWSRDSKYVLFARDTGGDENYHLFQVDPKAKGIPTARDLTPMDKVRAGILSMPIKSPNEIVAVLNDRDPKMHDVVRIDLTTGQRTLVWKNTQGFVEWLADLDGHLRLAMRRTRDGGSEVFKLDGGTPTPIYSVAGGESVQLHRFTADGNAFYFASNKGELDKMQLMLFDLKTAAVRVIDKDPKDETDIAETVFSDVTNELIATVYVGDRRRVYFPPSSLQRDFEKMKRQLPDVNLFFDCRTADERWWFLYVQGDTDKGSYQLFDRKTGKVRQVRDAQPDFPAQHLSHIQIIRYKARDGLEIPAYMILPKGIPAQALPTIVFPHGGPWWRDRWEFHAAAQMLANRGYAVLQPNFRGSIGYGKKFFSAGDKQWGTGSMQHDVTDGVRYLIEQGIADPKRIGIAGFSYGGYATLAGLAFTPELYAAGFDAVGISNLITCLNSIPPYWETERDFWARHLGDPNKPEDRKRLMEQSPINAVSKIRAPLFVVQGANDPRVKKAESEQIVVALRDQGKSVEYMCAPDEGHWFDGRENRIAMFVAMERFFAKHLGGRVQQDVPEAIQKRIEAITVNVKDVVVTKPAAR
jgi:dipeptidyl aminopeptidase/acylaminoacyl peptidase